MKFHWFHLMPYPHLPDDFRQKHKSVWVDVPSSLYDPVKGHTVYNDYLDELEYAEQCGFDGICVNEHHSNAYGMMPSPNLMAAALTRRTQRAKIIVMGNSVALYNPPTRIAEEFAMLDVMSGGRLVAGFPVGTPMDTVMAYGQDATTLREKYREGVDLIMRAWKSDEVFSFNGKYTQLRYVNPWPKPIQRPSPPVWVPGGGSVETWDYCVKNNFLYANLSYWGYKEGQRTMSGYWDAVQRLGADPNPYRAGFLQFIGVANTDAEAQKLYEEPARYFYNRCLHIPQGYINPPGYQTEATIRKTVQAQLKAYVPALAPEISWKEMVDRRYLVAGSPATVVDQLKEMASSLKIGHLMVLLHYGNMNKQTTMLNTQLFGKEVIPKLRDIYGDSKDHWWPTQTLSQIAKPAPNAWERT